MLVLLYFFPLQDSGHICFGYCPEKCCQRKKIINQNSDCMPAMVLPVAREPKVSTAQRPGTVRPIMREAVCNKRAVKIRLLEGPHPRAFAAACFAYLIYLHWTMTSWFCMPWENIAFLWRTFLYSPEYADMPWLSRWAFITGFIIFAIIKNCYCLFYHHQNAPHPRYCEHDNDPNMIEKGQL